MIRIATLNDVGAMVRLAAKKHAEYEPHSKVFWRVAPGAEEKHRDFLTAQIVDDSTICLVHQAKDVVDGFLIANVVTAPPVYAPGGKACVIDDFAVEQPELWQSVGVALKREAEERARVAGAVVVVVVCGHHDRSKRDALMASGSVLASEWFVSELTK